MERPVRCEVQSGAAGFVTCFLEVHLALLGQHGSCSSAQLPVELSEKRVTKPFPQPAALDCIVWGRLYNFLTDETIQQIPKLARLTLQPFY